MHSPLYDVLSHHPAYNFGRLDRSPPDRDRQWSELDAFEKLEQPKPVRDDLEEEWHRSDRGPATLVGDLAAALLVMLAIWGSIVVLYGERPGQLAAQPPEPTTAATALTSR